MSGLVHHKGVTLAEVRKYVQNRENFGTSTGHLFAHTYGHGDPKHKRYVVYSYGSHWPLFVYDYGTKRWFENSDKYSVTTSKHRTKAHPHCETTELPREQMTVLADHGYRALATVRMGGEVGGYLY